MTEGHGLDDERAVRALVLAYARHADRREPELLAELFEPDASMRMVWRSGGVAAATSRGHRQIASAVRRLSRFASTLHVVANHAIDLDGRGGGRGEVYCVAHHLAVEDNRAVDHIMFIRYLDQYRRTDGRWRFAGRETFVEWTEERAAQA